MATTDRYRDANGNWVDGGTDWFTVKTWGNLAENALYSLHKGDPIIASGKLRMETWTTAEGAERCAMVLTASAVGHDLNLCTVMRRPSVQQEKRRMQDTDNGDSVKSSSSSPYEMAPEADEEIATESTVTASRESEPVF
ncbi:hypothetical protein BM477_05085 [Boudabousia marimammalium]|uniref:Single-stranded DNA-binding protein n=1 Tax=Boudabousia marimammalium TaxID=156892 RepID=A0A1Q5PPA6_9ACTO|nr:hypothetical protein BM477_05085 [Boudabousia marimammalium]